MLKMIKFNYKKKRNHIVNKLKQNLIFNIKFNTLLTILTTHTIKLFVYFFELKSNVTLFMLVLPDRVHLSHTLSSTCRIHILRGCKVVFVLVHVVRLTLPARRVLCEYLIECRTDQKYGGQIYRIRCDVCHSLRTALLHLLIHIKCTQKQARDVQLAADGAVVCSVKDIRANTVPDIASVNQLPRSVLKTEVMG